MKWSFLSKLTHLSHYGIVCEQALLVIIKSKGSFYSKEGELSLIRQVLLLTLGLHGWVAYRWLDDQYNQVSDDDEVAVQKFR